MTCTHSVGFNLLNTRVRLIGCGLAARNGDTRNESIGTSDGERYAVGASQQSTVKARERQAPTAPSEHTAFLVIGAGPFGLAMAAQAQELGVDHVVGGQPMSFWKRHMPAGVGLRSRCDWHLDPTERDTIVRFLETRGQTPSDVEPLTLAFYREYAEWFREVKGIRARSLRVTRLDEIDGHLKATLDDGTVMTAERVLLALGFAPFAYIPDELAAMVPAERSSHSCDCDAPDRFAGERVL